MPQKVSKDLPLAEITLRRYEKPSDLSGRDLVKKLALTLGLLQPGDSRDIIVDIMLVLLNARKEKVELSSDDIRDRVVALRKESSLALHGVAHSNVRRQLKRLKDLFIIETVNTNYRITEFMPLSEVYSEKIENFLLGSIVARTKEYLARVDESF